MKKAFTEKKPNILMIVSDQHRYDCTGYSCMYPVKTPNIDRIASEGIWFLNSYTPLPTCCPARQALLSGRRPEALGALWNYDITLKIPFLKTDDYTWTKALEQSGYNMGYIGKWHVSPDYSPLDFGFNDYIPENEYNKFRSEKYPDVPRASYHWGGGKDDIDVEASSTHWLAARANELISRYASEDVPWHIRLDFWEPHLPCQPAGKYADMYKLEDVPQWGSFADTFDNKPYIQKQQLLNWNVENYTWENWAPVVARYYGIISQMDNAIGKVLDYLDAAGLAEDTIVIYTSDHGDMCGGHRMVDKHYILYDDVVRVPLAIRWPGMTEPGSVCDSFVSNFLDLPPTILDITGLEKKDFFNGESLLPFLCGEKPVEWRQEAVSTYNGQQFGLYTQRMIRNNEWKYIWNTTDVDELYDVVHDPHELINLIHKNEYVEILAEMRKKLYTHLKKDGDWILRTPSLEGQLLNNKKL